MSPRTFKTLSGLQAFVASHDRGAFHVLVLHDAHCSPSRCSCKPWYEVRDLTASNVLEGEQLEARWRRETVS